MLYRYIIYFYAAVYGHLEHFHFLAIMNIVFKTNLFQKEKKRSHCSKIHMFIGNPDLQREGEGKIFCFWFTSQMDLRTEAELIQSQDPGPSSKLLMLVQRAKLLESHLNLRNKSFTCHFTLHMAAMNRSGSVT